MGREERRMRERIRRQLTRRLGRDPTKEEIELALAQLELTQQKEGRKPQGPKPKSRPFAWKQ